jgi:RNA polymerase sigma-70 factor (ECF subfamily)
MHRLTDEQLVERLQQGQTGALDQLYTRYARKLYAFCYATTHSVDSEDLVHDVFLRVIKASHTFNPQKAAFRTWLFRIARNHCIDVSRHAKRFKFVPFGDSAAGSDDGEAATGEEILAEDTLSQPGENVESALIKGSMIEAVRDCIDELEQWDEKQAILLYYLADQVYREIGEMLGKSTSMARNYVKSAQQKVKRCLEGKGVRSVY